MSLFCFTAFANPKYITPSDDYHIVKKGDTIYSISKKYGISVEKLKAINNLKSDTILIGQKIYLKPRKANQQYYVTKRNIPKCGYHIVKKGETLYRIHKLYDVPLEKLMDYNQLASYTIKEGEKIWLKESKISRGQVERPSKVVKQEESPSSIYKKYVKSEIPDYHIVQKGENLYRIAIKYNLSLYELRVYNDLPDNNIFVGQKLYLKPSSKMRQSYATRETSLKQKDYSIYKNYGLIWPYEGKVISPFGMRDGKPHKGIDIKGPIGQPIKAVLDGTAVYVGRQRGYGNVIILKHKHGLMTVYAHNQLNYIHQGDTIKKGDKIATIGQTGNATCPHIHFETRIDGKAINPMKFLD